VKLSRLSISQRTAQHCDDLKQQAMPRHRAEYTLLRPKDGWVSRGRDASPDHVSQSPSLQLRRSRCVMWAKRGSVKLGGPGWNKLYTSTDNRSTEDVREMATKSDSRREPDLWSHHTRRALRQRTPWEGVREMIYDERGHVGTASPTFCGCSGLDFGSTYDQRFFLVSIRRR
jgi:hypothetical protein